MTVTVAQVFKRIFWSVFLIAVLILSTVLFLNRQAIEDSITAYSFAPSSEVIEIKHNLDLTKAGETLFLATEPEIEDREAFNENCQTSTHSGIGALLGCYAEGRMHLFNIADERLAGIIEVTAAHELLHASYDRMSHRETEALQKRLIQLYEEKIVNSPELEERMSVYAHLSVARLANEIHSVLATEVRYLPDWLEKHYENIFNDRGSIVDFYDSSSGIFDELQTEGLHLVEKLEALTDEIDAVIDIYTQEVLQYNREWEIFRSKNEAFEYSKNPDEFYKKRNELDAWREDLERQRNEIQNSIDLHDSLRSQIEELNHVSLDLFKSMDSAILPADDY